ncbi:hypothetical protein ACFL2C_02105 [Patescibacteria group bacterium]
MKKPAKRKKTVSTISAETLRQKLKLKHFKEKTKLAKRHPHVDTFFKERNLDPTKIREHSAKVIGTGVVAGALIINAPQSVKNLPPAGEILQQAKYVSSEKNKRYGEKQKSELLRSSLASFLPHITRPLERNEEKLVEEIVRQTLGVRIKANLEGEHLNTTYGRIGAEQHLRRYPGDVLGNHGSGDVIAEGIAPGLGAWGYFAPTKEKLNQHLEEAERWYVVVQTLYLPDWNTRQPYLKNWYRHRKVVVINTLNGKAVVGAIADSGPAAWTGKHYGGSPEVMDYLGGQRYKKGPVLVFFVDDPENKVPLGPVE